MLGKPRGRLYEIADESNIAENELRMGGPPVDNVAIDEEGSITLRAAGELVGGAGHRPVAALLPQHLARRS